MRGGDRAFRQGENGEHGRPREAAERGRKQPARGPALPGPGRGAATVRLSLVSMALESGDKVRAQYSPRSVTWLSYGEPIRHSDLVHVWIGDASVYGPPAVVVDLLGQALREAYAAWGDRSPDGPGDGPVGAAAAAVAPPALPVETNEEEGER